MCYDSDIKKVVMDWTYSIDLLQKEQCSGREGVHVYIDCQQYEQLYRHSAVVVGLYHLYVPLRVLAIVLAQIASSFI